MVSILLITDCNDLNPRNQSEYVCPADFFLIFQLVWYHFALYFSHWSDFSKYRIVSCTDVLLESSYLWDEIMSPDALPFEQLETCGRWGIRYVWHNIVMKSDWVQLRAILVPLLFMAQPGDTQSYNWKCPLHFSRGTKQKKVSRFLRSVWILSSFANLCHAKIACSLLSLSVETRNSSYCMCKMSS